MLLAMKDEAGSNLSNEENDFMLDTSYGEKLEELTVHASSKVHEQVSHAKRQTIIQTMDDDQIDSNIIFDDPFVENNSGTYEHDSTAHEEYREIQMLAYNVQHELEKKAFKEREDQYLDDILDLEEKLSSHDRIVYKMGQSIQTIHMLGKKPNKVYDPFLKAGNKLVIHSTDSEESLEDAEESQNKMRHYYEKLNALYDTFVPQQELSAEQTYFSIPSTFENGSKSKDVPSESPERRWMSDSQNELREFYKTDVIPMSRSLYKTLSEIKEELIEEVQEMLNIFESMEQKVNGKSPTEIPLQNEIDRLLEVSLTSEIRDCVLLSVEQQKHELLKVKLEKSASDSRDIQANLLKRIKILENDFQRSQAQSIEFELELQHQKEKMACDVSWKAKLSTLHDENVLLKQQVIQLVPWIVDSGCSKHMTSNLQLRNFVEKFIGTVRFGNDHFAAIQGYRDYVQDNLTICHVYYVEGLGLGINLFLVWTIFHMAQHVIPAAQLVPQYKSIGRCNNYAVSQSIPCSPECKIVRLILLYHCLSYALIATADWKPLNPFVAPANIHTIEAFINRVGYQGVVDKVSVFYIKNLAQPWQTMFKVFNRFLTTRTSGHDQTKINILQLFNVVLNQTHVDYVALLWWDFMNNVFQKKEAIQYPRFIKLIVADLMDKFPNIPKRLDEDYHSIKDDVPLVSVYTTRNVLVRGMLIPDALLTAKIRETDDFKEYEMVFIKVDVPMNQPQPVVSTQGTNRNTPMAPRTPTISASPQELKKKKQTAIESSSRRIIIRKKKQSTPSIPPPGDDIERDEMVEFNFT
ncbi:hypothetical protein Tco_0896636 [Tanacetum coccineum]